MGVYFPNMKFPQNCGDCDLLYDCCACGVTHKRMDFETMDRERHPDCPAVAVLPSPHGRLIDADAQDAQIEALIERHLHGYTKSTWDFVCELRDILKRNRTVIPAEEGST